MRKLYPNSRIKIWDSDLINNTDRRQEADKNVDIVQIEHADGDDYIVEIVDKKKVVDEMDLARQIVDGVK